MELYVADPAPLLIFDFDGTVCTGDEAVLEYARRVGGDECVRATEAFLETGREAGAFAAEASDGWQAVMAWGNENGASADDMNAAFQATRQALRDGEVPAHPPVDLVPLLDRMRSLGAVAILATNSPAVGMAEMLDTIGVAGHFDEVVVDAGKPGGMKALVERLSKERPASSILSIGDLWVNDLAPAQAAGAATAYIDRWNLRQGEATFRAETLPEMYAAIENWVRERV